MTQSQKYVTPLPSVVFQNLRPIPLKKNHQIEFIHLTTPQMSANFNSESVACLVVAAVFKTVEGQSVLGGFNSFPLRQISNNQGFMLFSPYDLGACQPLRKAPKRSQMHPKRATNGQQK